MDMTREQVSEIVRDSIKALVERGLLIMPTDEQKAAALGMSVELLNHPNNIQHPYQYNARVTVGQVIDLAFQAKPTNTPSSVGYCKDHGGYSGAYCPACAFESRVNGTPHDQA